MDREGRPLIVNPFLSLAVAAIVILIYVLFVPFSFVFKADEEVVYTQKSVRMLTDFEKDAEDAEGAELVYGEGAEEFSFISGEESVVFEKPYTELRTEMFLKAVTNLFTLKWDKADFVIEMDS